MGDIEIVDRRLDANPDQDDDLERGDIERVYTVTLTVEGVRVGDYAGDERGLKLALAARIVEEYTYNPGALANSIDEVVHANTYSGGERHTCHNCGNEYDPEEQCGEATDEGYCDECYHQERFHCESCGECTSYDYRCACDDQHCESCCSMRPCQNCGDAFDPGECDDPDCAECDGCYAESQKELNEERETPPPAAATPELVRKPESYVPCAECGRGFWIDTTCDPDRKLCDPCYHRQAEAKKQEARAATKTPAQRATPADLAELGVLLNQRFETLKSASKAQAVPKAAPGCTNGCASLGVPCVCSVIAGVE